MKIVRIVICENVMGGWMNKLEIVTRGDLNNRMDRYRLQWLVVEVECWEWLVIHEWKNGISKRRLEHRRRWKRMP